MELPISVISSANANRFKTVRANADGDFDGFIFDVSETAEKFVAHGSLLFSGELCFKLCDSGFGGSESLVDG